MGEMFWPCYRRDLGKSATVNFKSVVSISYRAVHQKPPQNSLIFVGLQSERYLHQVLLLKLTHYERNRRMCFTK